MKGIPLFLASLCLALPAQAQQDDAPEYNPPARGAPSGRVGGGTRGLHMVKLTALAPDHTGLTINAQPALYYYLPAPGVVRLSLRLANDPASAPVVEKDVPAPAQPGIQRLELKTLGVTLAPGIEYRWSVAPAGDTRAATGASIRRVAASPEMMRQVSGLPAGRSRYSYFAREGLWYDALDEVSRSIDAAPSNPVPARHRAALLEQIGLKDLARQERQRYE